MQSVPQTIEQVTNLYTQLKPDKSIKNLKTVLRKYILPFLPSYEFSFVNLEHEDIISHLHKIPVEDFRRAKPEAILNDRLRFQTDAGNITKRTADGYRSEFKLFTKWMQEQDWYIASAQVWDGKCAPLIRLKAESGLQQIKQPTADCSQIEDNEGLQRWVKNEAVFHRLSREDCKCYGEG